jgi:hypothetical protein
MKRRFVSIIPLTVVIDLDGQSMRRRVSVVITM